MTLRTLTTTAAAWAVLASSANAATNVANFAAPTVKTNGPQVCEDGKLNPDRLAAWYYYTYPSVGGAFTSVDDLKAKLENPASATDQPLTKGGLTQTVVVAFIDDNLWQSLHPWSTQAKQKPDFALANAGDLPENATAFFGANPPSVICNQPASPPPPPPAAAITIAFDPKALRLRGSSDSLVAANSSSSGSGSPAVLQSSAQQPAFQTASAASFSLSDNSLTHTWQGVVTADLGYDLPLVGGKATHSGWYQADLIPFLGADISLSSVSGKPASSNRENLISGVVASAWYQTTPVAGQPNLIDAVSGTYAHYWNRIDHSELNFLHLLYQPYVAGAGYFDLNESSFIGSNIRVVPLVSFLADAGLYNDRGIKPSANPDYIQVGGLAGLDVNVIPLNSDLSVTETYLLEAKHRIPYVHLLQASWTLNLSPVFGLPVSGQAFGLKASYQDGLLEATRQATKQWSLSLTAKY